MDEELDALSVRDLVKECANSGVEAGSHKRALVALVSHLRRSKDAALWSALVTTGKPPPPQINANVFVHGGGERCMGMMNTRQ